MTETTRHLTFAYSTYDGTPEPDDLRHALYLDPETRRVSHYEQYGDGTPMPVHHGRALLIDLPRSVVGTAVREVLTGDDCCRLLIAICDRYIGSEWNGSNHVGRWQGEDDEYGTELQDMVERVKALFEGLPSYWSAGSYLTPVWNQEEADNIRRLLADKPLDKIVEDLMMDARSAGAYLEADDLLATLEELLAEYPVDCE